MELAVLSFSGNQHAIEQLVGNGKFNFAENYRAWDLASESWQERPRSPKK
jgi:hypothetical protein